MREQTQRMMLTLNSTREEENEVKDVYLYSVMQ